MSLRHTDSISLWAIEIEKKQDVMLHIIIYEAIIQM